jgi:hypothetical protein
MIGNILRDIVWFSIVVLLIALKLFRVLMVCKLVRILSRLKRWRSNKNRLPTKSTLIERRMK